MCTKKNNCRINCCFLKTLITNIAYTVSLLRMNRNTKTGYKSMKISSIDFLSVCRKREKKKRFGIVYPLLTKYSILIINKPMKIITTFK